MGAGSATVMINLQVVIVLLAAWLIWDERPARPGHGMPVALGGIVFISGVLEHEALRQGSRLRLGAGASSSGGSIA